MVERSYPEGAEALLPCPFCGSSDIMEGVYYADGEKKRGAVRCADCGVRAPTASWNKRTGTLAQSAPLSPAEQAYWYKQIHGEDMPPEFAQPLHHAQSVWMPIETAPRDGTAFLAIQRTWWTPVNGNNRWVNSRVFESRWLSDKDKFWDDGHAPTHWAALPGCPLPSTDRGSR